MGYGFGYDNFNCGYNPYGVGYAVPQGHKTKHSSTSAYNYQYQSTAPAGLITLAAVATATLLALKGKFSKAVTPCRTSAAKLPEVQPTRWQKFINWVWY